MGALLLFGSAGLLGAAPGVGGSGGATRELQDGKPQRQSQEGLLSEALELDRSGALTPKRAATLLLNGGPRRTATLYRALESDPRDQSVTSPARRRRLESLRSVFGNVPPILARIAAMDGLDLAERTHAVNVALESLRGQSSAVDPGAWTQVLGAASRLPYQDELGARIRACVETEHQRRDLRSGTLARWIQAAGRTYGASVVDGAARARALLPLAGTLHHRTGHEGAVLNRVASLVRMGVPVTAGPVCAAALPYLDSDNAFERAESAALFGLVGDRRHVRALVARLDDDSALVRAASLKALKALTGMTISGDAGRWTHWYEEQEAWWQGTGAGLVAGLPSAQRAALVRMLKEVATRRLYRREISPALVQMLAERPADEMRVTIAALSTLRDPESLPVLLALRDHDDEGVRASVADAVVAFRHAGIKPSRVRGLPSH